MAQSATLPPQEPPALVLSLSRARRHSAPAPLRIAPADAPEEPLSVEFVGLSPEAQRRALAGWPGARRFCLVTGTSKAS
jgi:hypothetical protein